MPTLKLEFENEEDLIKFFKESGLHASLNPANVKKVAITGGNTDKLNRLLNEE
jgi:hypothetical protein